MGNDWSLIGNELVARSQTAVVDFVWQNNQLSQLAWNRMNSSSQAFEPIWQEAAPADWQVVATGDLNQDKRLDLLWRHRGGTMVWWVMESAGSDRQIVVLPSVADANWQVIGTGDSNRDGQLDILWRHTSGINSWWQMGAYQPGQGSLNVQSILPVWSVVGADWQAGGVSDANRDGISDIFWYHRPSGTSQWWLMDQNGAPNVGRWTITSPIPTYYSVKGITDSNGDGQLDLIFQDSWGNTHQWLMQAPSASGTIDVEQRSLLSTGLIESGWQIVGAANTSSIRAASANIMVDAVNSLAEAWQTKPRDGIFTVSQSIGGSDPKDYYLLGVGGRGIFTASLTGLTADADLRLISDTNGNAQVDSSDDIVWQWERGSQGEFIRRVLEPGGYFVEVSSYDGQVTNYALETFFQPLAANQVDPLKFDIQINYGQGSDRLDANARAAIEDAALFWERVIPYRSSNSLLPNGNLPITIVTEDLNLTNGNPDTLTLAFAGPQVVSDGSRLRLQSGTATINSRKLLGLNVNELRALLIHEFSHVLGFGTLWDPLSFWAPDNSGTIIKIGTRSDRSSWIDRTNQTYRADSYAGWAYGELLKAAGRTSQVVPTAVPLEAQFFAHWSESVFQNESLTPVAPSAGTLAPVSQLTLAALKDLGWAVNFAAAQDYQLPTSPGPTASIDFSQLAWNGGARSVQAETSPREAVHQGSVHSISCGCHQHLARSTASSLPTLGSQTLAQAIGI